MELSDSEFASYFSSKTQNYHTRIEHSISDVLARFSESRFYEPLNYAMQGGKRIRPLIVLLCHDALSLRDSIIEDPLPAAVAVELLHLESIIHDDIIDEDTERRERLVFHVKYGLSTSILSADFVLGIILDIASQYTDTRIGREISKAALRMSEGEFGELRSLKEASADVTKKIGTDEYVEIVSQKTASLFQTSAKLGAIIAGAKQQTIESMSDFGMNLGIAYQMQDDLLDWRHDSTSSLLNRNLNAVETDSSILKKMSYEYAQSANRALAHVPESEPKQRLSELAQFAVRRRF